MKKQLIIFSIIVVTVSCKKFTQTDFPPNQLTPEKVFNNNESAMAATANLYTLLGTLDNFVLSAGTYSDELVTRLTDAASLEFSNSKLSPQNTTVRQIWQNLYFTIYRTNAVIEGVQTSTNLSDSIKRQATGEAKFIRAFCYFYLVNIFGDVPLVTVTAVDETSTKARGNTSDVYAQIINDLKDAQQLLPVTNSNKTTANKWGATALLARIYLFKEGWQDAESQATTVINSGTYSLATNLNSVFLAGSSEAIFQYWNSNGNSALGTSFVPSSGVPIYSPTDGFLNAFESGDLRKANWLKSTVVSGTTYLYPYKYKQRTTATGVNMEYSMYLRLAEVYLIRAEARAQQNELTEALADLNLIRNRAGLPNSTATTKDDILNAIYKERRIEFFTEAGLRFFDLKRTKAIDSVMQAVKPSWTGNAALFPIPQSEILLNPNLSQNPGYN